MIWTQGRKLGSYSLDNGNTVSYKYDANGSRYQKTCNGVTTRYYLEDGEVKAEERVNASGDLTDTIYYIYDGNGVSGMIYKGSSYYFQKDVLGDIIAVKNTAGATVATYSYDAYGNSTVTNASGSNVGNKNPFRYRGYYFDTETGFYYLQSRYYDPSIMRFINADDYELISTLASTIGQLNLYAYCNDNPIMYTDETGTLIWELVVLGIFAAIGAGVGGNYFNQLAQDYSPNNVAGYTVLGALVGGLLGAALGALLILLIPSGGISIPIIKGSEMVLSTVGISQAAIAGTIAVVVAGSYIVAMSKYEGGWPGDDPTVSPGDGFEWRGTGKVGSNGGSWYNKETGEYLRSDLHHGEPIGPHWDYRDILGKMWRIFKNGMKLPK